MKSNVLRNTSRSTKLNDHGVTPTMLIPFNCSHCDLSSEISLTNPNPICQSCGRVAQVGKLARALCRLFYAAPDPYKSPSARSELEATFAGHILHWLSIVPTGDAFYIGRGDWVRAGCPCTLDELISTVSTNRYVPLDAISRMLSHPQMAEMLAKHSERITLAVLDNLERGGASELERERLFRILVAFGTQTAVDYIVKAMAERPDEEGNLDAAVGHAAHEAILKCESTPSRSKA